MEQDVPTSISETLEEPAEAHHLTQRPLAAVGIPPSELTPQVSMEGKVPATTNETPGKPV
jgi:hypothetical protein